MKSKITMMVLFMALTATAQVRNFDTYKSNTSKNKQSKTSNDSGSEKFTFGGSIGVNIANMIDLNTDIYTENNMLVGLRLGANAQYQFIPVVGFKTGLHYSQIGSKYTYVDASEAKMKTNQLQIPILLNIRLSEEPKMYIGLGMQYGIRLSTEFEGNDFDYNDYYSKGDLQGMIDFDVYFSDKLFLKTGMFMSLKSIVKPEVQADLDLDNETNIGVIFSVNYNF